MAIKDSENPPVVFPNGKSVKDFTQDWWVAHTKARNEKALAKNLADKGIAYFLPLVRKVSKTPKGRTIRSMVPLFAGYLFFCSNQEGRTEVLRTNRAANIIPCKNRDKFVSELWSIQKAIEAGANLQPFEFVEIGEKCRVTAGPLAGAEGIVIQNSRETRLILQVDMLGQATSVEIDADLLEKL